jgi:hypothetical protein
MLSLLFIVGRDKFEKKFISSLMPNIGYAEMIKPKVHFLNTCTQYQMLSKSVNSSLMDLIRGQSNPAHNLTSYLFKIRYSTVIFTCKPKSSSLPLSFRFAD